MTTQEDGRAAPRIRTQQAITDRYGKPWREVIRLLYEYHDSVGGVAATLGLTKPLLYRWLSPTTFSEWKAQNRAATIEYLKNPARTLLDDNE